MALVLDFANSERVLGVVTLEVNHHSTCVCVCVLMMRDGVVGRVGEHAANQYLR